jgi:hypothetical protein
MGVAHVLQKCGLALVVVDTIGSSWAIIKLPHEMFRTAKMPFSLFLGLDGRISKQQESED